MKTQNMVRHPGLSIAGGLLVLAVSVLEAQYAIDWSTVDGGGGTSTNGQFTVTGTIGQPDAGTMSGTNANGQSFTLQGGFWSVIGVVPTPGAPPLVVLLLGNEVRVQWTLPDTGWVLEQTPTLTGSPLPWSLVPTNSYQLGGTNRYVSVTPPVGNRFYRLRGP